jgi:hypothetical protein
LKLLIVINLGPGKGLQFDWKIKEEAFILEL